MGNSSIRSYSRGATKGGVFQPVLPSGAAITAIGAPSHPLAASISQNIAGANLQAGTSTEFIRYGDPEGTTSRTDIIEQVYRSLDNAGIDVGNGNLSTSLSHVISYYGSGFAGGIGAAPPRQKLPTYNFWDIESLAGTSSSRTYGYVFTSALASNNSKLKSYKYPEGFPYSEGRLFALTLEFLYQPAVAALSADNTLEIVVHTSDGGTKTITVDPAVAVRSRLRDLAVYGSGADYGLDTSHKWYGATFDIDVSMYGITGDVTEITFSQAVAGTPVIVRQMYSVDASLGLYDYVSGRPFGIGNNWPYYTQSYGMNPPTWLNKYTLELNGTYFVYIGQYRYDPLYREAKPLGRNIAVAFTFEDLSPSATKELKLSMRTLGNTTSVGYSRQTDQLWDEIGTELSIDLNDVGAIREDLGAGKFRYIAVLDTSVITSSHDEVLIRTDGTNLVDDEVVIEAIVLTDQLAGLTDQLPAPEHGSILNVIDWGVTTASVHAWDGAGEQVTFSAGVVADTLDHIPYLGNHGYTVGSEYVIKIITSEVGGEELTITASTTTGESIPTITLTADGSGEDLGGGSFAYTLNLDLDGYSGQLNRLLLEQLGNTFAFTIESIRPLFEAPVTSSNRIDLAQWVASAPLSPPTITTVEGAELIHFPDAYNDVSPKIRSAAYPTGNAGTDGSPVAITLGLPAGTSNALSAVDIQISTDGSRFTANGLDPSVDIVAFTEDGYDYYELSIPQDAFGSGEVNQIAFYQNNLANSTSLRVRNLVVAAPEPSTASGSTLGRIEMITSGAAITPALDYASGTPLDVGSSMSNGDSLQKLMIQNPFPSQDTPFNINKMFMRLDGGSWTDITDSFDVFVNDAASGSAGPTFLYDLNDGRYECNGFAQIDFDPSFITNVLTKGTGFNTSLEFAFEVDNEAQGSFSNGY